jgi:hypothetical protein
MKPTKVVELVEYDAVVREFAEQYFIIQECLRKAAHEIAPRIDGIEGRVVQENFEEETQKILKELAANMRLPPKAEMCCIEFENGVEYRINNDMSWLRKIAVEALRPPDDETTSEAAE